MNYDSELKKLERLFSNDGGLRSLIPKLIENKAFYDRLKCLEENWLVFKDSLMAIGILVGDALAIYNLIKTTPKQDIEGKPRTNKKKNQEKALNDSIYQFSNYNYSLDGKEDTLVVVDDSENIFKLGIFANLIFDNILETTYSSLSEFETEVFNEGVKFGVLYQKHHCAKSMQFYMRCSFHRKQDPSGVKYNCGAYIYGSMFEDKISIKKIKPYHTHHLMTSEAIKLKMGQMKKFIPDKIKEEAYRLFINGESINDIYNLLKKTNYPQNDCPFTIDPMRNYLYNRNRQEFITYENISQMYEKLKSDQGITKLLALKTFGDNENLRGLSFTFHEQISYGKIFS